MDPLSWKLVTGKTHSDQYWFKLTTGYKQGKYKHFIFMILPFSRHWMFSILNIQLGSINTISILPCSLNTCSVLIIFNTARGERNSSQFQCEFAWFYNRQVVSIAINATVLTLCFIQLPLNAAVWAREAGRLAAHCTVTQPHLNLCSSFDSLNVPALALHLPHHHHHTLSHHVSVSA